MEWRCYSSMKKVILAGALGSAALAGTNLPGLETIKASGQLNQICSQLKDAF